ncbi:MAG: hypothetical protein ACERKX_12900 [Anaerolineales bacterium]|jgi:hypothetical protein
MPTVYWFVRLKPGVQPEEYIRFVQEVDYAAVKSIPSIVNYRSNRVLGSVTGKEPLDFDFIDIAEITNLDSYLKDLKEHPAVEEVHSRSLQLVEVQFSAVSEIVDEG